MVELVAIKHLPGGLLNAPAITEVVGIDFILSTGQSPFGSRR
jgi:hypothetical protein